MTYKLHLKLSRKTFVKIVEFFGRTRFIGVFQEHNLGLTYFRHNLIYITVMLYNTYLILYIVQYVEDNIDYNNNIKTQR